MCFWWSTLQVLHIKMYPVSYGQGSFICSTVLTIFNLYFYNNRAFFSTLWLVKSYNQWQTRQMMSWWKNLFSSFSRAWFAKKRFWKGPQNCQCYCKKIENNFQPLACGVWFHLSFAHFHIISMVDHIEYT